MIYNFRFIISTCNLLTRNLQLAVGDLLQIQLFQHPYRGLQLLRGQSKTYIRVNLFHDLAQRMTGFYPFFS